MKKANTLLGPFILVAAVLAGCGGGGDDDRACSTAQSLSVGLRYMTAGISSADSVVGYELGVPFINTPVLTGVPASCEASKSFTFLPEFVFNEPIVVNGVALDLGPKVEMPDSVTLDGNTGTFAGTLTVPLGLCIGSTRYVNKTNPACAAGGTFVPSKFNVKLSIHGFSAVIWPVTFVPR